MPIYEYACGACEHRFETIQRASDAPLEECPACGASALRKLLSAPVFRLKGGGWYETDFKTGKKKNVSESGDGDGKASDGDGKAPTKKDGDGAKAGSSDKSSDGSKSSSGNGSKADKATTTAGA